MSKLCSHVPSSHSRRCRRRCRRCHRRRRRCRHRLCSLLAIAASPLAVSIPPRFRHKLRLHVEGVEKERDFYFSKLQDIEAMLQAKDDAEAAGEGEGYSGEGERALAKRVFEVLYATTEDFVAVDPDAPEA